MHRGMVDFFAIRSCLPFCIRIRTHATGMARLRSHPTEEAMSEESEEFHTDDESGPEEDYHTEAEDGDESMEEDLDGDSDKEEGAKASKALKASTTPLLPASLLVSSTSQPEQTPYEELSRKQKRAVRNRQRRKEIRLLEHIKRQANAVSDLPVSSRDTSRQDAHRHRVAKARIAKKERSIQTSGKDALVQQRRRAVR